jgi:hypothetical protein
VSSGMNYGKPELQGFTDTSARSVGPSGDRPPAPEPRWAKVEGLKSPPMRNIKDASEEELAAMEAEDAG